MRAFVAMSFKKTFAPVFQVIKNVCDAHNASPFRADQLKVADDGNVFDETASHGVRGLVTTPELLAPIEPADQPQGRTRRGRRHGGLDGGDAGADHRRPLARGRDRAAKGRAEDRTFAIVRSVE